METRATNIVVVADDDAWVAALTDLLAAPGRHVVRVSARDAAVGDFGRGGPPAAVFVDLEPGPGLVADPDALPDADQGLELFRRIRATFGGRDLPVVVTAGPERAASLARALDDGAAAYLVRPPAHEGFVLHALGQALGRLARPDEAPAVLAAGVTRRRKRLEADIRAKDEELRTASARLVHKDTVLRTLLESLPNPVFHKALNGEYLGCNKAFCDMLGRRREEIVGRRAEDFFPEDLGARFTATDQALVSDAGATTYEYSFRFPDGSIRHLTSGKAVYADENGRPSGLIGVISDITRRKRAEDELAKLNRDLEALVAVRTGELERTAWELREANARLVELDDLKSAFLATVSHDLRSPLASIVGFVRLIARDMGKICPFIFDSGVKEAERGQRILDNLDIVRREGERLIRLVSDFLDLTRIEAGKMSWREEPVDVATALREAVQAVGGAMSAKPGLSLGIETQPGLPSLYVDPDRLTQVLVNLLSNAIKFTAAGAVTMRAASAPPDMVRIDVVDTGEGIGPEDLEKIFDRFVQAKRRQNRREAAQGTGLGLAICKSVAEHYGGRIEVASEPGRGSVFSLYLPARAKLV